MKGPKRTNFEYALGMHFSSDTVKAVRDVLEKLQLPMPEDRDEYISGTDGVLIFSNPHGVVIRIEHENGKAYKNSSRADSSPWMLQPLGSIPAANARIEICPGVHFETNDAETRKLYWKMWGDGYNYWDERLDNVGRLPLKLPQFPQGVPVVIDRLAVRDLANSIAPARRALALLALPATIGWIRSPIRGLTMNLMDAFSEQKQMLTEAWKKVARKSLVDPAPPHQEILYGALKKAFRDAWPEGTDTPYPEKMKKFWDIAAESKKNGILVDGWNEVWDRDSYKGSIKKPLRAQMVAESYAKRLTPP